MYIEYCTRTCIVFALELALKEQQLLTSEISVIYGQRFLAQLSGKLHCVFIGITSYSLFLVTMNDAITVLVRLVKPNVGLTAEYSATYLHVVE